MGRVWVNDPHSWVMPMVKPKTHRSPRDAYFHTSKLVEGPNSTMKVRTSTRDIIKGREPTTKVQNALDKHQKLRKVLYDPFSFLFFRINSSSQLEEVKVCSNLDCPIDLFTQLQDLYLKDTHLLGGEKGFIYIYMIQRTFSL